MKKIILVLNITIAIFNPQLFGKFFSIGSCGPNETENTYTRAQTVRISQKEPFKISPKDLEKQAQQYIENNETKNLDALLKKLDAKTKKNLLSKKITISYPEKKPYTTDLLNFAIIYKNLEITKILINHGAPVDICADDGYSPLTRAVGNNLSQIIDFLVKHKANINACDANGNLPLEVAVYKSHLNLIQKLINLGAKVNLIDNDGLTPLAMAINKNDEPMVKVLIEYGADVNLPTKDGYSPINRAIRNNVPHIIEILVKYGANVNGCDANDWAPLYLAIQYSYENIISLLIKLGADINFIDDSGVTFLAMAINSNNESAIKTLIKNGADVNFAGIDGYSPLNRAVQKNLPFIIDFLVSYGAQINEYDANGNTALVLAARNSQANLIPLLIKLGADVNKANSQRTTPLHAALYNNDESTIKTLLQYHANINAQDATGNTPLHIAIEKSYDDIVSFFIQYGADPDIPNNNHFTPAELAPFYGKSDIVKLLFKDQKKLIENIRFAITINDINAFKLLINTCKSDPFLDRQNIIDLTFDALDVGNKEIIDLCIVKNKNFIKNSINGMFPIHYTIIHGHHELLRHFVDNLQADINQTDDYGFTPLHYACMYGNYEIVEYLVNKKCLINIKTAEDLSCYKKGSTPCDIAIQQGNTDIVEFLLKQHATMSFSYKKNIKRDQSMYLAIFVDSDSECIKDKKHIVSVKRAFSQEIHDIIKQKTCPLIIIGQHMLHNAIQLSCSLEDWLIVDFSKENIDGYILVPKKLIDTPLHSDTKNILDIKMQYLGFSLSPINHDYINEERIKQKKYPEKDFDEKDFSALIPKILDTLLMPRERYVYWGGHGNIVGDGTIGGISRNNAKTLFTILAKKHTNFLYVSSCFFSGKNYEAVNDIGSMIVISAATTEISVSLSRGTHPTNWNGFFNVLANYKNRNESLSSFQTHNDYLANAVLPNLITHSPNITNFPHIKFPGKPFTLLLVNNQATLLDKDTINNYTSKASIDLDNQRLLEITIPNVKNTIKIKENIPFVVSNTNKNVFEKIYININNDNMGKDLINIFEQLALPNLFHHSTLENTFLIKELTFSTKILLRKKDTHETVIPETVYNIAIKRGPGPDCWIFFSTNKNPTPKNSFFLMHDVKNKQWDFVTNLSENDFAMYQCLLKQ